MNNNWKNGGRFNDLWLVSWTDATLGSMILNIMRLHKNSSYNLKGFFLMKDC